MRCTEWLSNLINSKSTHIRTEEQMREGVLTILGAENAVNADKTTGVVFTSIHDGDLAKWGWSIENRKFRSKLDLEGWGDFETESIIEGRLQLKDLIKILNLSFSEIFDTSNLRRNAEHYERVKKDLLSGICSQLDIRFVNKNESK
jgi:hypothetical protein